MSMHGSEQWEDLYRLLADLASDTVALCPGRDLETVRPRFIGPLLMAGRHGPMTVRQLAARCQVTHSAMSQTVAAMRSAGLVETVAGPDGRTRLVRLTDEARERVPALEARRRAVGAAHRALDGEVPYSLLQVVEDIRAALAHRSFIERLRDNLSHT